jgi:capsular exopolysaccharide synthesis family protein
MAAKKIRPIMTFEYPDSIISEHFRMIQTNINFLMTKEKGRTLLITSPSDGEGKSSMVANLAVSITRHKEKVLLIDANLRKPVLHSLFNTSNSTGLIDVLTGKVSFYEAVQHTNIGRLDLLPSGLSPNNLIELLDSHMMDQLLDKVGKSYDIVLIDTHSLLEVIDTQLLVNKCDGVVLVIRNGKTKFDKAEEAKKVLEFAKAKILGVVMNH